MSAVRKASGRVILRLALQKERIISNLYGEDVETVPIIERALEPLDARSHKRILMKHHKVTRKAANTL